MSGRHASAPATSRASAAPAGRATWRRWELLALVELWALCGLAIAQPLLDIVGRAPDFFLFHGARYPDILLLAAAVTVAPPLLLWGIGAVCRLGGRRARRAVHVLSIGGLSAALAVQAGKWLLPVRGLPLALLAVACGAAAAAGYLRWAVTTRLLRLTAVGPLVFVLLFVFVSPTSALVLGARGKSAGSGRPVGPHPPLVVIIFDELPQLSLLDDAGRIDEKRFPNFARLAGDATWYRNATAVRGFTPYAVPSMLTGRYPTRKAAPHYTQYPDSLFTALAGSYDLRVQESVVNLCPPEHCGAGRARTGAFPALLSETTTLLEQVLSPLDSDKDPTDGFTEPTVATGPAGLPAAGPVAAGPAAGGAATGGKREDGGREDGETATRRPRPDDGVATFRWSRMRENQPTRFRDFVAGLRPSNRPTLHFLHLLLPHKPFRYLPSGLRYPVPAGLPESGEWWAQLTRTRHLLQARYVDRLLGEALRTMRRSGLYDEATVVVTADHGIAFTPQRAHQRNIFAAQQGAAEIAWVPLFIKAPGQTVDRQDHRNWLQIDLLPTLADHAGVELPFRVDGVSALREPRSSTVKPFTWNHGREVMLDSARHAAAVLAGPDDALELPDPPRPDLVGKRVADLPVAGGGTSDAGTGPAGTAATATVANLRAFRHVRPASGTVPALVYGTVSGSVPAGAKLAIALNGTIAAVVPVLPRDAKPEAPRFAGVIAEESLFRPGANRLELFLVGERDGSGGGPGRTSLRRLGR